jgi:hypothetical protein
MTQGSQTLFHSRQNPLFKAFMEKIIPFLKSLNTRKFGQFISGVMGGQGLTCATSPMSIGNINRSKNTAT